MCVQVFAMCKGELHVKNVGYTTPTDEEGYNSYTGQGILTCIIFSQRDTSIILTQNDKHYRPLFIAFHESKLAYKCVCR